ncbi:Fic family protein [Variovorax sp. RTB1]|uniref:Fic family protein n=1 Tax=Variovorax sp. RTB1 TaxID=3048631 RepID=UPI002B22D429|nr:Fic family protein [Variovorax sp. RTB1]MEB0114345.1 Fic family protein [Variovorax sp. RTB1]
MATEGKPAASARKATPAQSRLVAALRALGVLQEPGVRVFKTSEFSRKDREALLSAGFLQRVIHGWYMSSGPLARAGDTAPWTAGMKDFIAVYCNARFGADWCMSAEYSLRLHAGTTLLPQQVVVHSPLGKNSVLDLPNGFSLMDYQARDFPEPDRRDIVGSLRTMTLAQALLKVPENFFRASAEDAQVALLSVGDASELNRLLAAGNHSTIAGRLAGAFRAVGRVAIAEDVVGFMRALGNQITESNPFAGPLRVVPGDRSESPYVSRLRLMWDSMRDDVASAFPQGEPGKPVDVAAFMQAVEDVYVSDAYHSLSIEGYRVTPELIRRVASGDWNEDTHVQDRQSRDAMAAHGYWLAHNEVKESIRKNLVGANAGDVLRQDHGAWFRAMFAPSVTAGLLAGSELAGYRGNQVYIRNAHHVPPPREAVREMMPVLFELLRDEPLAAVRAVLGHFMFVFIHPYTDGNGRLGRFIMNAMLASGGFPWTVLRLEHRDQYMAALDAASGRSDIRPFASFVARSVGMATDARAEDAQAEDDEPQRSIGPRG